MHFVDCVVGRRRRRGAAIFLSRGIRKACPVVCAVCVCTHEGSDLAVGLRFYAASRARTLLARRFLRRTRLTLCSGRAEPLDVVIARSLHGKGRPTGRTLPATAVRPFTE